MYRLHGYIVKPLVVTDGEMVVGRFIGGHVVPHYLAMPPGEEVIRRAVAERLIYVLAYGLDAGRLEGRSIVCDQEFKLPAVEHLRDLGAAIGPQGETN